MAKENAVTTKSFADYLAVPEVQQRFAMVIGKSNAKRFTASIVSAVQATPKLANCNFKSIVNCALLGETLGLTPSPQLGQFFIIPYGDEASFQLGYKGYVQMAIRSGEYEKIKVLPIKKGELKKWDELDEEIEVELIADQVERENAETVGYYGMIKLKNGFKKSIYWSKEKMVKFAEEYSQSYKQRKDYSFWVKDFDLMASKTLLRQLISKWGIMSLEMQRGFKADMGVITSDIQDKNSDFDVDYIDNPENERNKTVLDVKPEPVVVLPTLDEALEYVIDNKAYAMCCGHKLKELVESTKMDPTPMLEALSKSNGIEGASAQVVLNAIETGDLKIKFVAKTKKG